MAKAAESDFPKADRNISFEDITKRDPSSVHGWMRKQTKLNRTLEAFHKSVKYQWPKRIIVLSCGCLYAYRSEKDKLPCAAISLHGFSNKLEKLGDPEKPYQKWGFSVKCEQTDDITMCISALSEQQREYWMKKFSEEIDRANSSVKDKPPPIPSRRQSTRSISSVFDDDEPDPKDEYWSIKDAQKLKESSWPSTPAPKPPEPRPRPPPPEVSKPPDPRQRPLPPKPDAGEYDYVRLEHEDLFQRAYYNSPNGDRLLDGITEEGVYLIRDASNDPDKKTLSVVSGHVRKYRILHEAGHYVLELEKKIRGGDAAKFPSMNLLLEHYYVNVLPSTADANVKLIMAYGDHPMAKANTM